MDLYEQTSRNETRKPDSEDELNRYSRVEESEIAYTRFAEHTQIQKFLNPELKYQKSLKIDGQTLVTASSFRPYSIVKLRGIEFKLVLDEKADTVYFSTNDKEFRTPEGFHVGMTFEEIPDKLREELEKENGWGYFIPLNSGWNLGFCEGNSCTESLPEDNSSVKWIFKR